jgi:DNA-binding LacI/PurR family transcriptional regulator
MASQNEIAKRAGVSQSVVSRVLNGRAKEFGITAETVQRVTALAVSFGYRPNPAASMLLGGASKLVGVVVRSFDDPYLAAILQELNRGALAAGRTLLVAGMEGDARQRADEIRLLQHYRPDALIVVGSTDFSQWADDLFVPGKPVVQIGLPVADPRVVSCGLDEAAAAQEIVRHLHESGHHRCGSATRPRPARPAPGTFAPPGPAWSNPSCLPWTCSVPWRVPRPGPRAPHSCGNKTWPLSRSRSSLRAI